MTTTPTLVLDPGHGGDREVGGSSPNNTSGGGVLEKDVTLDMARRVRQRLAGRANVLLTRDSDTNLSLAQRAGFARAVGADLFLSLHCNGHVDPSHDSIEVYVNRDGTESDRAFAADLEAALASAIGAPESDVIQADLGVIKRDRHTPGTIVALVEMFDLTNPARAQAATDVAFLDTVATALAQTLDAHLPAPTIRSVPGSLEVEPSPRTPNVERTAASLRERGVPNDDIEQFLAEFESAPLQQLGMPGPRALENGQVSVQLPPAHLLEWWQDELITAALSTTPIGLLLPALRALSTAHNVTIGIGPAVSGGIVAGAGLSIGMVIAPGGHLGFYGTVSGLLGAIVSISATATVTVVFGGPSVFNGSALAAGVSIDTGVGPMIAAHVLMSTSGGGVIGVSGEIGVSVGPSPFEAFAQYQYTVSTLGVAARAHDTRAQALERPWHGPATLGSDIPLDPGVGGQSIGPDALEIGDVILSTTDAYISDAIRSVTGSPVSHAAIYVGDDRIVEAVGGGVEAKTLDEALADDSLAVAVRLSGLTAGERDRIKGFALSKVGQSYDGIALIRQALFRLDDAVWCSWRTGQDREDCRQWAGRVNLGSGSNDAFFCSELVIAAYAAAGRPLTSTPPSWTAPGDLAELMLNQQLGYVGHLKTPPVAAVQAASVDPRALVVGDVVPDFSAVDNFWDWIAIIGEALGRHLRFTTGVENPTFFPHSAICQLEITSGAGTGIGTGFYIAPDRILTAGHNLALGSNTASRITVHPGRHHNMSTFPSFTVTGSSNFVPHPNHNAAGSVFTDSSGVVTGVSESFSDWDLGVIKVSTPPPNNTWFAIEEQQMSPLSGIVVCGYAAEGSDVEQNQQNMDVDSIRDLHAERFTYALHVRRGTSGAPVFYVAGDRVIATGVQSTAGDPHVNTGCRLTDAKVTWIQSV